ncbi:cell wall-binding repeat-containing protein [Paradesulfitobacterium ferrireducens]|uniref:cell wall-binding repeat-containing protein n=1 Tax=Paradesulfitobacterium ferrireducens TaxID=2816476 RepID=UPI001A903618|nr:cell wall-binding repeat-containing protein [Paradesulfitobacterium ferrireducens]
MNKRKKVFAALALAGMVLSTAPIQVFATTTASAGSSRLAGLTRIETAIAIADAGWSSAETAVIAPSEDEHLVDALAAAPLAGQENAPILLTEGNKLNGQTKIELAKLKVKKTYVVGAIDQTVVAELNGSGITATAIKGSDRVDTATQIAAKLTNPQGSFVVGYGALPDALSVASYAAANHYSILIADPAGKLPQAETAYAKAPAYLLGGPTLVADGAVAGAARIAGLDRFETNDKVMAQFADSLQYEKVYVANGEDAHLVDSLVASSLAGQTKSPILLGTTKEVKAAARVGEKMTAASQTIALGGPSVVPDSVRDSVAYKAPEDLAVESVSAINISQLAVTFNKPVDVDSAEDYNNYTVEDDGDEIDVVHDVEFEGDDVLDGPVLLTDGKTVIITVAPAFDNPTTASLTIEGVKDLDGKEMPETEIGDISVSDTAIPEVTNVEVLGYERMRITFSEPITMDPDTSSGYGDPIGMFDPDNYVIDDGDYVVADVVPVENLPQVELELGTDLTDGKHTIEFNEEGTMEDGAGYKLQNVVKDFEVVPDTSPITAEVLSADQTEVVIKWNKPVKVDDMGNINIYHTSSSYEGEFDLEECDPEDWESEWTIDFTEDPLPDGKVTIYIEQLDEEDDPITDSWDVELHDEIIKLSATVELDDAGPTVESVETDDGSDYTEFTVSFSEEVNHTVDGDDSFEASALNEDNYKVENADGDELELYDFEYDEDTDEVIFKAQEEDEDGIWGKLLGGDYTITIDSIEDTSPLENEMAEYSTTVEVTDETSPEVEDVYYFQSDKTIAIIFNEEMATSGDGSIADPDNYMVSFNGGKGYEGLDDSDDIEVGRDNTYVLIDLSDGTLDGVSSPAWDQLYVSFAGVEDPAGNKAIAWTTINGEDIAVTSVKATEDVNPGVTEVDAIATDEIEVEFDTILDDVNAEGVSLVIEDGSNEIDTGITFSVKAHEIDEDDDVSLVTFNLSKDLNYDGTFTGTVNGVTYNDRTVYLKIDENETGLESVLGTPAATVGDKAKEVVLDDISPEMDTVEVSDDGMYIVVTFTEPITAVAKNGFNGFKVTGDGIFDHSYLYDPDLDGVSNKVLLVADDDDLFSGDSVVSYDADLAGIQDDDGNYALSFSNEDVDDLTTAGETELAALLAVEKAEKSKAQADVDAAQDAVNDLPAGATKTALQDRVDAVQDQINAANAAAVEADKAALTLSPADPAAATTTIALPATGASGSTITWAKAGTGVAEGDGTVTTSVTTTTRPTGSDPSLTATLTATITKGTATATQTFTVTVPATGDITVTKN